MKGEKKERKNAPPVKTLSAGSLSVAIWENRSEATEERPARIFYTATFERRYMREGNWQGTAQLRKRDLLPMQRLLGQTYDYLLSVGKGSSSDEEINEEQSEGVEESGGSEESEE